jgi:hypothetical protein
MYIVESQGGDPYGDAIKLLVQSAFPNPLGVGNVELLEILTEAVLSTGQNRNGPRPKPESIVEIRKVLTHYIAKKEAIPFLIPWGSRKTNGTGVDLAEVSALKQLSCLQNRIARHYQPGAQFNVRVEDTSGLHLFQDNPNARYETLVYVEGLEKLVYIFEMENYTFIKRESFMGGSLGFDKLANKLSKVIFDNIVSPEEPDLATLEDIGWEGGIGQDTIDYYMSSYRKLYPSSTEFENLHRLARYFGGALARVQLEMRGDSPEWYGSFLGLSFVSPIPGKEDYFSKTINYRTMPYNSTRNHMPPWRAKGYARIQEQGGVRMGLASFNEPREYTPFQLTLSRDTVAATVNADYVLEGEYNG